MVGAHLDPALARPASFISMNAFYFAGEDFAWNRCAALVYNSRLFFELPNPAGRSSAPAIPTRTDACLIKPRLLPLLTPKSGHP